ncbi:SHOCT domain-containing protein [Paramaledivibacter caminithermalis]|jgi:putative membrane protein|uniref:Putative membrane protein n=1 Tax=Paramaledivibacter caminithermalis (strain DSM 15212 / CIP 107654 / DViRD3) TaxID=1121301 RepID=A0A1M6K3V7_PARC5|nr:SHOCT domain-containing protein [Paramaledivibacter caminithermalis]SHJ53595.1 putative membrane protein [Paramaledivibacter caminithermalis DSM 15212]
MCGFWGLNFSGGNWIWMIGFSLLRWTLIIGAAIWIVKLITKNSNGNFSSYNKAITLLQEKYANGEIPEEEYLRRKKILEN